MASGITGLLAEMDEHRWVPLDDPAIQYGDLPVDDPVARLAKQLESGKAKLEYTPGGLGYLPSLLKNLNVSVDSQVLVFSKTSFQLPKISPVAPRALFFSDNVAVGSVQGGDVLELAALDPKQGVTFYTLDVKRSAKPTFDRRSDCLQCHQGTTTLGIPGIMVTSVYPSGETGRRHSVGPLWQPTIALLLEIDGEDGTSQAQWARIGTWGIRSRTMRPDPEIWIPRARRTSRAWAEDSIPQTILPKRVTSLP